MSILNKAAAGILTLALSFSIVGTSVAPTFADDTGKNLHEMQQSVEQAQEDYNKARITYDDAATNFLESKLCDFHRENLTVEQYIHNLKNATGRNADLVLAAMEKRDNFFTKDDGTQDTEKKSLYRQHWISFENLKLQATWLDELNKDRANDKNEQAFADDNDGKTYSNDPLKLNPELMLDSMMSAMVTYFSDYDPPHLLANTSRVAIPRAFFNSSENLSSEPVDPLLGWYDDELRLYNEGNRDDEDIGHYKNCMKRAHFVGFGMYAPSDSVLGGTYDIATMRVSLNENWIAPNGKDYNKRIEEKGYTSEEWLKEVNAYEAQYKKNLDEAKTKLDNAKTALRNAMNPGNSKPDFSKADVAKEKAAKLNKNDYIIGFPPVDALWYDVEDAMKELDKVYKTASKETSEKESEIQKKLEDASTVNDLKAIYQDEAECYAEIQKKLDAATDKLNNAMSKLNSNTGKPDNGNTDKPDNGNKDDSNIKQETILSKMALSTTKYAYNGKSHTPSVKVYDKNGMLVESSKYKLSYSSGRKNLGSYMITATGIGYAKGTVRASYVIAPAKMKTPSVKAGKKKITVKWKKLGGGSQSYQIYALKKGTKKAKYYTSNGTSKTISKLTKKKYYTVKIRAFKKISGKTYYGAWSNTKKVKVK